LDTEENSVVAEREGFVPPLQDSNCSQIRILEVCVSASGWIDTPSRRRRLLAGSYTKIFRSSKFYK